MTATAAESPGIPVLAHNVPDLAEAVRFYRGLGFRALARRWLAGPAFESLCRRAGACAEVCELQLGREVLALTCFVDPGERTASAPRGSSDLSFQHMAIVVADVARAWAAAADAEAISSGPQTIPLHNPVAGGVSAAYLRDPHGHAFELLAFPPDRGDRRWHVADDPLFRGIDHTAIVVADTDSSLDFYCGGLGFVAASQSLNEGPEQDALTAVAGAKVRITRLDRPGTMSIELLEYLAPRRAAPPRPAPAAWAPDRRETFVVVRATGEQPTADWVDVRELSLAYAAAAFVADPDGHMLRLVATNKGSS